MYEKALIMMIFLYATSFSFLFAQFMIADVFGLTIKNYKGAEIKSAIVTSINQESIKSVETKVIATNFTLIDTAAAFVTAGNILKELFLLLIGVYIFEGMYQFLGADTAAFLVVSSMILLYVVLLARAGIAYVRGI